MFADYLPADLSAGAQFFPKSDKPTVTPVGVVVLNREDNPIRGTQVDALIRTPSTDYLCFDYRDIAHADLKVERLARTLRARHVLGMFLQSGGKLTSAVKPNNNHRAALRKLQQTLTRQRDELGAQVRGRITTAALLLSLSQVETSLARVDNQLQTTRDFKLVIRFTNHEQLMTAKDVAQFQQTFFQALEAVIRDKSLLASLDVRCVIGDGSCSLSYSEYEAQPQLLYRAGMAAFWQEKRRSRSSSVDSANSDSVSSSGVSTESDVSGDDDGSELNANGRRPHDGRRELGRVRKKQKFSVKFTEPPPDQRRLTEFFHGAHFNEASLGGYRGPQDENQRVPMP